MNYFIWFLVLLLVVVLVCIGIQFRAYKRNKLRQKDEELIRKKWDAEDQGRRAARRMTERSRQIVASAKSPKIQKKKTRSINLGEVLREERPKPSSDDSLITGLVAGALISGALSNHEREIHSGSSEPFTGGGGDFSGAGASAGWEDSSSGMGSVSDSVDISSSDTSGGSSSE